MRFSSENTYTKNGLCNFLYDKANHLGNVLTVVSDKKIPHSTDGTTVDYFLADVLSVMDYYAFGGLMPGRNFNDNTARYQFNSKEYDQETGTQDYGMRIYNPNLGRFFSVDPLTTQYPWYSPYQFAGNNPIRNLDLDGKEELDYTTYQQGMIEASVVLTNAPFPDDIGGGHWTFTVDKNNVFFTTDGFALILKPGQKPDAGIKEILAHPDKYAMDCGTYVQVTKLAGMLKSMGDEKFNEFYSKDKDGNYDFKIKNHASSGVNYSDLYMSIGGGYVQGGSGTFKADKLVKKAEIGTEITLATPALEGTAFAYENIVKVGDDKYVAQGLGKDPMSMKEIKNALNEMAKAATGKEKNDVYIRQVKKSAAKVIKK